MTESVPYFHIEFQEHELPVVFAVPIESVPVTVPLHHNYIPLAAYFTGPLL